MSVAAPATSEKQQAEKSPDFRELLQREFQRMFERAFKDIPFRLAQIADLQKLGRRTADFDAAFVARIYENTYHPSQIVPIEAKKLFHDEVVKAINKAEKAQEKDSNWPGWSEEEIREMAGISTIILLQEAGSACERVDLQATPSNALLKPNEFDSLKNAFLEGKSIEDVKENYIPSNKIDAHNPPLDEAWETAREAKNALIVGGQEIHTVWIDFDGAKRPEGILFSIYANLLWDDIQFALQEEDDPKRRTWLAGQTTTAYNEFLKIDALIHALTAALRENPDNKDLESQMKDLIQRRKAAVEKLVKIRNRLEKTRKEEGKPEMVFLSKRIRFTPRLDHKSIEALKLYYENKRKIKTGELTDDQAFEGIDRKALEIFWAIIRQVSAANELAQNSECYIGSEDTTPEFLEDSDDNKNLVPQIMIAMAQDAQDIFVLWRALREEQNDQDKLVFEKEEKEEIEGEFLDVTREVKLVPLFEEQKTTSPEFIRNFLEQLWKYFRGDKKRFEESVNEVFFAGSDLSKEVGQLAAINQVWIAANEIEQFNKKHGLDIRIKLGSGETLLRQLGFFDPEAFRPLARKNVEDEDKKNLTEAFGKNWQKVLKRFPSGFNYILRKFPFINSFTQQSRAREQRFLEIPASQMVALLNDIRGVHATNLAEESGERFGGPPPELSRAAADQTEFFQEVLGKPEDPEKIKGFKNFGVLIEFIAKKIPAIRDRALARMIGNGEIGESIFNYSDKAGINTRAIGSNTAARMIFPLGLLGTGHMLEQADQRGELDAVLAYLNPKAILREMKDYEMIADEVFTLLQEKDFGFTKLGKELQTEWERIKKYRAALQTQLWREIDTAISNPKDFGFQEGDDPKTKEPFSNLEAKYDLAEKSDQEKAELAQSFVPGTRALLDPENKFETRRNQLRRKTFQEKGIDFLKIALELFQKAEVYRTEIRSIVEQISESGDEKKLKVIKQALGQDRLPEEGELLAQFVRKAVIKILVSYDLDDMQKIGLSNDLTRAFAKLRDPKWDAEEFSRFLAEFVFTSGSAG